MKVLKSTKFLIIVGIILFSAIMLPTIVETFFPIQDPSFKLVLNNPTDTDDFIFEKVSKNIVITKIQAIAYGPEVDPLRNAVFTVQKCPYTNSPCDDITTECTATQYLSECTLQQGNVNVNNGQGTPATGNTLKFRTVSVTAVSYLFVKIYYYVVE